MSDFNTHAVFQLISFAVPATRSINSRKFLFFKPLPSVLSALSRQLIVFVPAALILPHFRGVEGVLWAGLIADFSSAVLTLIMIVFATRDPSAGGIP